jgi:hypothetical protein
VALQRLKNGQLARRLIEVLHVLTHNKMPQLDNIIIATSCQEVTVFQRTILTKELLNGRVVAANHTKVVGIINRNKAGYSISTTYIAPV